jgi:hypothetical protein
MGAMALAATQLARQTSINVSDRTDTAKCLAPGRGRKGQA